MADLDPLAISQALAAVDPRWGEPTGTANGLLWRHADRGSTIAVTSGPDRVRDTGWWICATVTMRGDWGYRDRTLTALREAIWGPDGYCYVTYPPNNSGVNLVGRADGQPAPWGPP